MSNPDSGDLFLDPFMDDYFVECDEHLVAIRNILLEAERQGGRMATSALQELFRSFHSIKGLSGMVGLRDAELLAHHMESYLRLLRDTQASVTLDGIGALTRGTHALEQVIVARQARRDAPDLGGVLTELATLVDQAAPDTAAATGDEPVPEPPRERWRAQFAPSAALAARGIGVDHVRALLRDAGDILDVTPRVDGDGGISFEFVVEGNLTDLASRAEDHGLIISREAAGLERPADDLAAGPASVNASHFVRVDLARLDDLMRMIGDLVITRARLVDSLARIESRIPAVEWRAVQENSMAVERQLRDLRDGVMRVRLVKVGEIFRRMPFVVRDLARESGREVQLEMTGQDTEIDKFVVERLMDPILHLVRNAVSHGIEPAEHRVAAGKAASGKVSLHAASVGDIVVFEVSDDGHGVDGEAVARRARAAGLEVGEGPLDAAGLLAILCTPGFSTRDTADRAAGRGVGMAVVHTTVQELGGRLSLETRPGQGTRFTLEVPLTLSITDAILGRVGAQLFAVPQSAVREVLEVAHADLYRVEHHELIPYRDGALPVARLATVFGIESSPGRALHVFVIGAGASAVGLAVDRILGQREVVVRPLGDALIKVDGVAGATDLGDGRAVLILDPARLVATLRGQSERPVLHG
jgi:two-component system, chemotaxis family, sensor kinase CheA